MPNSGSQIIVFDRDFHFLAELSCLTRRDWVLNSWGECRFDFGTNQEKFTEQILRYGNHVLVRHPTLPDWVGVIDTPRTWGRFRAEISAVGAEKYFRWRHALSMDEDGVSQEPPTLEGTYGGVFLQLINLANLPEVTGILPGNIADGGPMTQQKLTGYLSEALQEMATRSKQYWDVQPAYTTHSDVLGLRANWYAKKGVDTGLILEEGKNIELVDKPMTEEGEIGNEVFVVGDTGVDSGAYAAIVRSSTYKKVGLRQYIQRVTGVNQLASVQAYAQSAIDHFSVPRLNFRLTVTDPAVYGYLITGNEATVVLKTIGFLDDGEVGYTGRVMISGVHYTDFNNVAQLDVKALNEVTWDLYG